MAVAVKTSPGARSTGILASPAILSLVGMVYLLACLAIVFKLIPDLWWSAWIGANLGNYLFVGGALLAVIGLACGVLLLIIGARLLGPEPPVGVRSGVFVAFVGILVVIGLTRWASIWLEHWSYTNRLFGEDPQFTGKLVVGAIAIGLLLAGLRLFTRPGVQAFIVLLERAGWFHATAYKPNQGLKVRRGTVAGLLLIVGAGIYTLVSHGLLGRGAPDLVLDIPYTSKVAITSFGDARSFIQELPDSSKTQVQIRWPGDENVTGLHKGEIVSLERYKEAVDKVAKGEEDLQNLLPAKSMEATQYLLAIDRNVIGARLMSMLDTRFYPEGVSKRLESKLDDTPWEDIGDIVADFNTEARAVQRNNNSRDLPAEFRLPAAVLVVDQFLLRNENAKTTSSQNVKIRFAGDSTFKEGEIVSRTTFDEEVDKLKKQKDEGLDRTLPQEETLAKATGTVQHAGVTLLPSVQFTIPLLLLAGSLWLAWRVVNMPTFADFLIATEAELNKVSWTTQKRLVQDTIVVLVTVFLMSVFLFGMDLAWKQILSWKYVGVLHIPKEQSQQNRPFEQKRW